MYSDYIAPGVYLSRLLLVWEYNRNSASDFSIQIVSYKCLNYVLACVLYSLKVSPRFSTLNSVNNIVLSILRQLTLIIYSGLHGMRI